MMSSNLFKTGSINLSRNVYTRCATDQSFKQFVHNSLKKHMQGNWGDLCDEDVQANQEALTGNLRLFSSYHLGSPKHKIWIITDADRSATTVMFPDDY